jgi:hypothetical protein
MVAAAKIAAPRGENAAARMAKEAAAFGSHLAQFGTV